MVDVVVDRLVIRRFAIDDRRDHLRDRRRTAPLRRAAIERLQRRFRLDLRRHAFARLQHVLCRKPVERVHRDRSTARRLDLRADVRRRGSRERETEDFVGIDAAVEKIGDAGPEHSRFPRTWSGGDDHRFTVGDDGGALFIVQISERVHG